MCRIPARREAGQCRKNHLSRRIEGQQRQRQIIVKARSETRLQRRESPHRKLKSRPPPWTPPPEVDAQAEGRLQQDAQAAQRKKSGDAVSTAILAHLQASTRAEAMLDDSARIQSLRRERWIDTRKASRRF
jgi:hypothetical protein